MILLNLIIFYYHLLYFWVIPKIRNSVFTEWKFPSGKIYLKDRTVYYPIVFNVDVNM
jgi:hypothetical protein